MSRLQRNFTRYALAAVFVAASTGVAEIMYRTSENPRLSMAFLAGVLVTAYALGSGPAYVAAGLAFLSYNFYLVEPRFIFSFESEDFVTLGVFLAVAMLTGNLTGRVRDQAARAEARARTTDALFRATHEFSALSDEPVIRDRLAQHLAIAARGEAFVGSGEDVRAWPLRPAPPQAVLEAAARLEGEAGDAAWSIGAGEWVVRTLRTGGQSLGVAGWRSTAEHPLNSDERTLLEILTDAGAAALARARLNAARAEAEARAKTEDLRNALLSSISHDLRTPLAAILASASSLEQFGEGFDPGVRVDLAATIREEAERLDAFVANLLHMSRVESGALAVQATPFSAAEVIDRTVGRRARVLGGRTRVHVPPDLAEVLGDPVLFEQALGNVVENALRHTPPDAPVDVSAWREGDEVMVEVADRGPGVSSDETDRIFEKFVRGAGAAGRPGVGLGLSIARGLAEAMGGGVSARNRPAPEGGLVVTFRLPAATP
ncbi:ATP-binding protein [Phenylobacterium sp.]|uniref:ATP-binding protein n=1 Tax=Phenylobacterium sp. TaxID=1871053 RepID=UPI00301C5695